MGASILLFACVCTMMPCPTSTGEGSTESEYSKGSPAWIQGIDRHGQDAMDAATLAAHCERNCTFTDGGCFNGNWCPIGCHLNTSVAREDVLRCVPCTPLYADTCSPFGSCDPHAGPMAGATEHTMRCVCVHGFKGRLCNVRKGLTGGGHARLFIAGVLTLASLVAFAACFRIDAKYYSDVIWRERDYFDGDYYPWYRKNMWIEPGPPGSASDPLGTPGLMIPNCWSRKDAKKNIEMLKVLFRIFTTFLQLVAEAFDGLIPWTWDFAWPHFLRYLLLDWPGVPFWLLIATCFITLVFAIVCTLSVDAKETRKVRRVFGKLRDLIVSRELGGDDRTPDEEANDGSCFAAAATWYMTFYELMLIPTVKLTGEVYMGCTYYDYAPNTFNRDPELSCYRSGEWWLYAISISIVGSIQVLVLFLSNLIAARAHSPFPKIRSWVFLDLIIKVFATLITTAYGLRHPNFSLHINVGAYVVGVLFVVVCRPHHHGWFNRFVAYGFAFTIITNLGAIHALEIDDPISNESKDRFLNRALIATMVYIGVELGCTVAYVVVSRGEVLATEAPRYFEDYEEKEIPENPLGIYLPRQRDSERVMNIDHETRPWKAVVDPNGGRTYYFNRATRETTWTRPENMPRAGGGNDVDGQSLNESMTWLSRVDPSSGRTYYVNRATRESSWTNPENNNVEVVDVYL